jgi:hypothetical protein
MSWGMVWNKAYVIQLDILEAVAETDICFLIVAYRSKPNIEHWKVFLPLLAASRKSATRVQSSWSLYSGYRRGGNPRTNRDRTYDGRNNNCLKKGMDGSNEYGQVNQIKKALAMIALGKVTEGRRRGIKLCMG